MKFTKFKKNFTKQGGNKMKKLNIITSNPEETRVLAIKFSASFNILRVPCIMCTKRYALLILSHSVTSLTVE